MLPFCPHLSSQFLTATAEAAQVRGPGDHDRGDFGERAKAARRVRGCFREGGAAGAAPGWVQPAVVGHAIGKCSCQGKGASGGYRRGRQAKWSRLLVCRTSVAAHNHRHCCSSATAVEGVLHSVARAQWRSHSNATNDCVGWESEWRAEGLGLSVPRGDLSGEIVFLDVCVFILYVLFSLLETLIHDGESVRVETSGLGLLRRLGCGKGQRQRRRGWQILMFWIVSETGIA
jgi:hypothetical protein